MTPRTFTAPILDIRVIDGDTFQATIDLGWRVRMETTIRLDGIDTPETRHMNPLHKKAGGMVRDWVAKMLTPVDNLMLVSSRLDMYGRSLGDVHTTGGSLVTQLILHGFAKATGSSGKRLGWTDEELQAIVSSLEVTP